MKRLFSFNLSLVISLACLALSPVWAVTHADGTSAEAELTFTTLGMPEAEVLNGPVSEFTLTFNLPAGWQPSGTARLDLAFSAFFSSILPQENERPVSGLIGGNLGVWVNGTPVGMDTLQMSGASSLPLRFDAALLTRPEQGGANAIRVQWDGSTACRMNLLSSITVLPDSTLTFTYTAGTAAFTLDRFPAPFIIKDSIRPGALTLVLPSSPSAEEWRAAAITAAGLGRLSGGRSGLTVTPLESFKPAGDSSQTALIVAGLSRLDGPELKALGLASPPAAESGEGLVHLFSLAGGGYALLVSGDGEGIVKAAQTVSLGRLTPSGGGDTMRVTAVNLPVPVEGQEDVTLSGLGKGEIILSNDRGLTGTVNFTVPAGMQPRPDSTLDLTISHSQQLDYLNSGLRVDLNGYPVISLRLSDSTSNENLFRVILPASLAHAGRNTLGFTASLTVRDICVRPDEAAAWLRVSADSLLHLPLENAVTGQPVPRSLGDFPAAFQQGYALEDVTLLAEPGSFENLKAAAAIAFRLGGGLPDGQPIALQTRQSGEATGSRILVGRPLDFPDLNAREAFPALTADTDNTLSPAGGLEVVSKPAAGADTGYLAIRGIQDQSTLAILGNTPAGVTAAAAALTRPELKADNFAVLSADAAPAGWVDPSIANGGAVKPVAAGTPAPDVTVSPAPFRQSMLVWVIPLMVLLVAAVVLLAVMEVRGRE
jgi:hypothetical protein